MDEMTEFHFPAHIEERIVDAGRGRPRSLKVQTILSAFEGKGRGKADVADINSKLAARGVVLDPALDAPGIGLNDLIHFRPLGQAEIDFDPEGPDLDPVLRDLHTDADAPCPTVAGLAMDRLCDQWLAEMAVAPPIVPAPHAADELCLACLLLAREDNLIIGDGPLARVSECLASLVPGPYKQVDRLPWLLVASYLADPEVNSDLVERVQDLLGCAGSSVRGWFHYVAWMIRPDLDADAVRPILLGNLADKLGFVGLSTGLLASLYDDKEELDAFAADFTPPEGFEEQYLDRIRQTRELEWNWFTFNLRLSEATCRELIWRAVRGSKAAGI